MRLDGVSQWQLGMHLVAVPATGPHPLQITPRLQVGDDALHGPLGDAHAVADLAQGDLGILAINNRTWAWLLRKVHAGTVS